jgi:hypothetical protein
MHIFSFRAASRLTGCSARPWRWPLLAYRDRHRHGAGQGAPACPDALAEEQVLTFHPETAQWVWDLDRAHAKGYTGNVADLMAAKLTRLPGDTQTAFQLLACLGNTVEIATFSLILDAPEQADIEFAGGCASGTGSKARYRFTHDRVQEIPVTPSCLFPSMTIGD